jgi:hypothetical protein
MTDSYDLIAIGAGPAGESATELAAFFGHRSLIIERNKPGGTVTTTGGAPTKTLREAALYMSGFAEGDVYGIRLTAPPEVATEIVRKRTLRVCEQLQQVTAATSHRGKSRLHGRHGAPRRERFRRRHRSPRANGRCSRRPSHRDRLRPFPANIPFQTLGVATPTRSCSAAVARHRVAAARRS